MPVSLALERMNRHAWLLRQVGRALACCLVLLAGTLIYGHTGADIAMTATLLSVPVTFVVHALGICIVPVDGRISFFD